MTATEKVNVGSQLMEFRQYIPEGGKAATTVLEALEATVELLQEEGRWVRGEWFMNTHPEVDPEDPFCNSWSVCAQAAIGVVTAGAARHLFDDEGGSVEKGAWTFEYGACELNPDVPRSQLYRDTVKAVEAQLPRGPWQWYHEERAAMDGAQVGDSDYGYYADSYTSIPEFNDHEAKTTRTDVIALFNKAIDAEKAKLGLT